MKATLKLMGKTYTAEGKTPTEAISNLKPGIAKGNSILTLEHKGKKIEKILGRNATARLFSPSPTVRDINLKHAATRFDLEN